MAWCGVAGKTIHMHTHTHTPPQSAYTCTTHTQYVPACLSVPQGFQHEVRAAALGPGVSEVPSNCSGTCGCSAGVGADCFCSKLLPTLIKCCLAQHVVWCVWHGVGCGGVLWGGVGWRAVGWCSVGGVAALWPLCSSLKWKLPKLFANMCCANVYTHIRHTSTRTFCHLVWWGGGRGEGVGCGGAC